MPGGPAQLASLGAARQTQELATDPSLAKFYNAKPLASFPAMLAAIRVQSSQYRTRGSGSNYVSGASYSFALTREVETEAALERLLKLPLVQGIAPISRLLVPSGMENEDDLRAVAARVRADILVLYTFDTRFYVKDFARPVSLITLGLSPTKRAKVTTTASAILMDVRSGYIYGGAEATAESAQVANGWTDDDAVEDTRVRTERESFEKLVGELEKVWPEIVKRHATTRPVG